MNCFIFLISSVLIVCSLADKCVPVDNKCAQSFINAKENIFNQNLKADGGMDKFKKNCEEFQKCSPSLKCGSEESLIKSIDTINSICEATLFRHSSSFEACNKKLKGKKCTQEWDPFPATVDDPVENDRIQKKFCDEFFGKDNCLEKEISEVCGKEIWDGFKKYQLALNKITGTCKFE